MVFLLKNQVQDMIDCELAYINTKHPDFVDCQQALVPVITGHVSAPAAAPTAAAPNMASCSEADEDENDDDADLERTKLKRKEGEEQQAEGGPFWRGWFGGGQEEPEPRPRRGGRRSSFGMMDPSELEAFRRSQKQAAASEGTVRAGNRVDPPAPVPLTRKELEVKLVQTLIRSYFDIVARDLCDKVPKAIMAFMVNRLKETLQNELITALYEDSTVEALMAEPSEVAARRIAAKAREAALLQASVLLADTKAFALPGSVEGTPVPSVATRAPLSRNGSNPAAGGLSGKTNPLAAVALRHRSAQKENR